MPVKIVFIEDDSQVRINVAELLVLKEYDVATADSGTQGINLIKQVKPDLILCDISMPDMDGHQVLTSIRNIPALSHTPFIFLTAKADMVDLRQAMNLGADDYLAKPFLISDLLAAIDSRLKRIGQRQDRMPLSAVYLKFIKGRNEKGFMLLQINECACFCTRERDYFVYHPLGLFQVRQSLDKLMKELDPQQFFRANRHIILNRKCIIEYDYWEKGKYCLQINFAQKNQEVILSKARFKNFREWLKN